MADLQNSIATREAENATASNNSKEAISINSTSVLSSDLSGDLLENNEDVATTNSPPAGTPPELPAGSPKDEIQKSTKKKRSCER
ncbi:hypothetical protein CKM354_001257900 [Cercospora kikuchii]|uniref:Uncharacterized protein n=1 Tax=Cercospora kikuchii TaxID=84275 RepID=A0A9P3FMB8_9PEZI|nr:uncharacterized protein CKM354_001257900 [Cercospora kikuchii]GIZ49549.1 hypothetical protein CKM354_001257900 [Cercospora kikuchii]